MKIIENINICDIMLKKTSVFIILNNEFINLFNPEMI